MSSTLNGGVSTNLDHPFTDMLTLVDLFLGFQPLREVSRNK